MWTGLGLKGQAAAWRADKEMDEIEVAEREWGENWNIPRDASVSR